MMPAIYSVGATDKLIRALSRMTFIKRKAPYLASWFSHPDRRLTRKFEVDFHGFRYRGEINNRIDWSVFFLADFLAPEVDLIRRAGETMRRLRHRFVCYDVGANIGHLTLPMANLADEVIAFDPSQYAMARLREKVSFNKIANIRYLNFALGESDNVVPFDIFSTINLQAKRQGRGPLMQTYGKFDATFRRGDDVVRKQKLPLPDFLRINTADEYIEALKGLRQTLRATSPIILIERPKGYCLSVDETLLRSVLYPEVELYSLSKGAGAVEVRLDSFSPSARRIVCMPAFLSRMAQQEQCKMQSLRLA